MTLEPDTASAGIEVVPSGSAIGAEIRGADLSHPVGDAVFAEIHAAFLHHSVICLREQDLSPEALIDFSGQFGALDVHHLVEHTLPDHPEVRVRSNVTKGRFVYRHRWQQGDVPVWDNRRTLHRMTPFPDSEWRVMYRTQIKKETGRTIGHECPVKAT